MRIGLLASPTIAVLASNPVWAQAQTQGQAPETGAWLFWTIAVLAVIGVVVAYLVKRR